MISIQVDVYADTMIKCFLHIVRVQVKIYLK